MLKNQSKISDKSRRLIIIRYEKPFFEAAIQRDEQRLIFASDMEATVLIVCLIAIPICQIPVVTLLGTKGKVGKL